MKSSIQQPAYGAIPLSAGGSAGVDASRLQRLVWVLVSEESDDALRVLNALVQGSIMLLILVVIVVDVLQTVDSLLATWDGAFAAVDTVGTVALMVSMVNHSDKIPVEYQLPVFGRKDVEPLPVPSAVPPPRRQQAARRADASRLPRLVRRCGGGRGGPAPGLQDRELGRRPDERDGICFPTG